MVPDIIHVPTMFFTIDIILTYNFFKVKHNAGMFCDMYSTCTHICFSINTEWGQTSMMLVCFMTCTVHVRIIMF